VTDSAGDACERIEHVVRWRVARRADAAGLLPLARREVARVRPERIRLTALDATATS
jgi:hypothetical protein